MASRCLEVGTPAALPCLPLWYGFRLVVDPSMADAERMAAELDRRTGLAPRDVDAVFVTHAHGDHLAGIGCFDRATWLAAPDVAAAVNRGGGLSRELESASGRLCDAVDVVPTPGHTPDHHSLRFDCDGMSVVVAGDAAMTRDFWRERRGFFNTADFDLAARTIDELGLAADVVIPGHDNFFLTGRRDRET